MSMGCVVNNRSSSKIKKEAVIKPTLQEYISEELANRIVLPELEWHNMPIIDLVQRIDSEHHELFIHDQLSAPIHGPLLESIKADGFLNPLLVQHQWYPMIGNQRIRCAVLLGEQFCKENDVTVARIKYPVWDSIGVWPDRDTQTAFLEIYFECISLVFKSRYNTRKTDSRGAVLRQFEQRASSDQLDVELDLSADWISNSSPA